MVNINMVYCDVLEWAWLKEMWNCNVWGWVGDTEKEL